MYFKKPNFWDEKLSLFSYLLLPLTFFIKIKNFLNNRKKKFFSKKLKTICVGNIYKGDTGKTPTTIKLFNLLKKIKPTATAKKYYPSQKDEEILLKEKTIFLTANNRKDIVKRAIKKKIEVVIFDDGLQDSKIDYDVKIVCFDSQTAVGNGLLIPAGPLRENLKKIKKYESQKPVSLIKLLKEYNPKIKIFTSGFKITNIKKINKNDKYLIFSGIGNPKSFEKILKNNKFKIIDKEIFPDHYNYTDKDLSNIVKRAKKYNASILTTEKDYVKIPPKYKRYIKYLKLKLIIHNEQKFMKFINLKI